MPLRNAGTSGKYNAAGLPDINGSSYNVFAHTHDESGALYNEIIDDSGVNVVSDAYYKLANIIIDASISSLIYGASDTVMPASTDVVVGLYLGRTA